MRLAQDEDSRVQSSVTERALTVQRIAAELRGLVGRCEDSAAAAAEGMDDGEQLPDVWQLAYKAALALAKAAAVDELLGNAVTSARAYHKVRHPMHCCPRDEWYLLLDTWLQAGLLLSPLVQRRRPNWTTHPFAPSACHMPSANAWREVGVLCCFQFGSRDLLPACRRARCCTSCARTRPGWSCRLRCGFRRLSASG